MPPTLALIENFAFDPATIKPFSLPITLIQMLLGQKEMASPIAKCSMSVIMVGPVAQFVAAWAKGETRAARMRTAKRGFIVVRGV